MAVVEVTFRRCLRSDELPPGWVLTFDLHSYLYERFTPLSGMIYVPGHISPVKSAEDRLLDEIRVGSRYGWFDGRD